MACREKETKRDREIEREIEGMTCNQELREAISVLCAARDTRTDGFVL